MINDTNILKLSLNCHQRLDISSLMEETTGININYSAD